MTNFTPEQFSIILQIVLGVVSVASILIGALAYIWKRGSDTKLEVQKRETAKAQTDAEEAKTLGTSLGRLIELMGQRETAQQATTTANIEALRTIRDEIANLSTIDTQRIKQNDITHAQIAGARDDIRKLASDFVAGKDDAVKQVGKAMDDKLRPLEQALQTAVNQLSDAQRDIAAALALLRAMEAKPAPPPHIVEKSDETKEESA